MEEAARIAALLPSIHEFADRFDTVLGERGVRLSGGQKQRTAWPGRWSRTRRS